jgi:hypothetical protein
VSTELRCDWLRRIVIAVATKRIKKQEAAEPAAIEGSPFSFRQRKPVSNRE